MPEGDAVRRTADRLQAGLGGRLVTDWDLRWPTVATSDKRGATTVEVATRGKHLLHRLDDGTTLHSHLRMEGSWRVEDPAAVTREQLRDHRLRALVGCATATALGWRLGMIDLVPTTEEGRVVGHLGPDLLGADWDADAAAANVLRTPGRAIGAALLDQRNLAGIGTIWNAETLFLERVDPWATVGQLGPGAVLAIVRRAHELLTAAMAFPWSVSTGDAREPTYAHDRARRPCRRCGTPIAVGMIGDAPEARVMYHCPRCQGVRAGAGHGS